MNDHKFSNQKSALEDYFESLLSDFDEDVDGQIQTEVSETNPESASTITVTDIKIEEHVQHITERVSESEPVAEEPITEEPRRTSVADMLATVEEKITEEPEPAMAEFAEPVAEISIPLPEVAPKLETEVVVEAEVAEQVVVEDEEVVTDVEEPEVVATPVVEAVKSEKLIPDWAEAPFQCLLFKVGGLSLAVPLVRLNGVIPWSEKVVETPNQTDWYLGVLMNHGHKVQVIDTAVMVLPAEHRQEMSDDPVERLSHILLVDDQRWGLACDSIGDVVWLKNTDVKWRSNKTKRPWLLGTAIDHMCAVMDTEAFADMLEGSK